MRTPHPITAHAPPRPPPNPYEELAALDEGPFGDGPLDAFLRDAEPAFAEGPEEGEEEWAPPNHRKSSGSRRGARTVRRRQRRGRRRTPLSALPLAAKAVIAVLVLAAFLALGDRWALLYAERTAAEKVRDQLNLRASPEVEIDGFPFVTQVLDRRLDSVSVTVPDVAADRISLAKVSATATGIRIDGGPTSLRGARIPSLDGEVLLSFDDLNRELGASQVTFTGHGGDEVRARGTLPVAGHDLRLRADARIRRDGERGIATEVGGMRLDIGDLATFRPGTRTSEGLHLTRESAARLAREKRKAKELLSVPAIAKQLGVPDSAVRTALRDDNDFAEFTGSPQFVRKLMKVNLVDLAVDHPEILKRLGFDPALLDGLSRLTRPALVDRLSIGFRLPKPPQGDLRLRDVRVHKDGISVRVTGHGLAVGK
ncbi:LmeA family phospholipid-binding protein [Streptomyces tauricus]|uniref:LmeA family phospholipid-binding protein n=1 Tax=Streptomyces tauricus TaxID=68274 RepID=UPI003446F826